MGYPTPSSHQPTCHVYCWLLLFIQRRVTASCLQSRLRWFFYGNSAMEFGVGEGGEGSVTSLLYNPELWLWRHLCLLFFPFSIFHFFPVEVNGYCYVNRVMFVYCCWYCCCSVAGYRNENAVVFTLFFLLNMWMTAFSFGVAIPVFFAWDIDVNEGKLMEIITLKEWHR